ncbi:hypothetical protein [Tenacibaculum ovolyticum]|uniref:hypothetical protein n=1 Tax=Tenacibaculum ovolyticum TaxID=104270 RepID=UPI001F2CD54A|nr:hypothetical protein [Tenacibaculum ovolyticum]
MKNLLYCVILIVIFGCSSSDDPTGSSKDSFEYMYKNEKITIDTWTAFKIEDGIIVTGSSSINEQSFTIQFNKYGNLNSANSYPLGNFNIPLSISYEYYKSNFFNFELLNIDESNNRVSAVFSGNLYEDEHDLDSEKHFVEGAFNISYIDKEPNYPGLKVYAEIEGKDWYSVDSDSEGGFFSGSDIHLNQFSDDEYQITFILNHDNTSTGNYAFDLNSQVNKVVLSKFDKDGLTVTEYETEGNFNLLEKNIGAAVTQLIGNYDLIAKKGNEIIRVTNGTFNTVYSNY